MLFQSDFKEIKPTNKELTKMSAIATQGKTYTQEEVNQLINNMKASLEIISPPESLEQIISEIDRITKGTLGFSEHTKNTILEFTEAITDISPRYKKQLAEGLANIVRKEEANLRRTGKVSFSENLTLTNLQKLVTKLNQKLIIQN